MFFSRCSFESGQNSLQEANTNPWQLEAVSPYMYIDIQYG